MVISKFEIILHNVHEECFDKAVSLFKEALESEGVRWRIGQKKQ